jgi:hypothetical protein
MAKSNKANGLLKYKLYNYKHYESEELSGKFPWNAGVINSFENLFAMRFAHVWYLARYGWCYCV